jgi:hypothetical protein
MGSSSRKRQTPEWSSASEEERRSRQSHLSAPALGRSGPWRWLQPGYSTSKSSPEVRLSFRAGEARPATDTTQLVQIVVHVFR